MRDELVTLLRVMALGKPAPLPACLQTRLNLTFREGILSDRRRERSGYLIPLPLGTTPESGQVRFLIGLLENDIAELSTLGRGRPADFQKMLFVREIAKLWKLFTGRRPSTKPMGRFDRFLKAAWRSGFEGPELSNEYFGNALKRLRTEQRTAD